MRVLLLAVFAVLALTAPALGEIRTLAEVHTPTRGEELTRFPVIDAHAGRVVWSDYDSAIDGWRLMEHAGGVTRALPVAPRRTPFDVDLGPDGRGGALAVYSRCARRLRFDFPTPQEDRRARRHGCNLYRYSFTTGRETAVASANSPADEYWPSVWGSRIAFVRGYPTRRDPDRTTRPYVYLRSLDGSGHSRRLRTPSPVITIRDCGPEGCTTARRRLGAMVEGLDLRGRTVAYAWSRIDDSDTVSFIYTTTAGGALRPAARGATSGGGAAVSVRSVEAPSLRAGGVDWLFVNRGEPEYYGAFARRGRASPRTKAVAFAHDRGVAYFIDGGPGAQSEPTAQPGGAFALKADDAVAYRRMPRSWLPIPAPR